jgi:hypothetical protein
VLVPDPVDRGHVDGMVEASATAQRQPVNLPLPRGHPGRGGAVAGGEMVPAGNRATVMMSPMTVAAMTGPTPNTSVRLVPDAVTAAASFF